MQSLAFYTTGLLVCLSLAAVSDGVRGQRSVTAEGTAAGMGPFTPPSHGPVWGEDWAGVHHILIILEHCAPCSPSAVLHIPTALHLPGKSQLRL